MYFTQTMDSTMKDKQQVGQYYLLDKIAQGGMAEIFKGLSYDVHGIKKTVCIKKILSHIAAKPEFIDSLIDEAKIAVKLVHGNIAQTYDLGKVDDNYFMVMEYVNGKTLSQIHKRCLSLKKRVPLEYTLYFITELLKGLDYIHRRCDSTGQSLHIVHRDISPQNVMVSYSGTVKIIDFGIAKIGFKAGVTEIGILKGKFAYMSPEQAYGDALDNRSDIFSTGIILYEMITGKRLFKSSDNRKTIRNVRRATISPPTQLYNDIPDELERIVLKSLSKDKRFRYQHASEFQTDLLKLLHTLYPEFQASTISGFIDDLFKDDPSDPMNKNIDSNTPLLIIDKTNSALADDSQFEPTGIANEPINLEHFMLEDESDSHSIKEAIPHNDNDSDDDSSEDISIRSAPLTSLQQGCDEKTLYQSPTRTLFITILFILLLLSVGLSFSDKIYDLFLTDTAEIELSTIPSDALIYLNDTLIANKSPLVLPPLTINTHYSLRIERNGYTPYHRTLHINDQNKDLFIRLNRIQVALATLELITLPPNATVFINDIETQYRTPAILENIIPNTPITIGIHLQNYIYWQKTKSLHPDKNNTLSISLMKNFSKLNIDTQPSHALIMLNDIPIGQSPLTYPKLDPGKLYKVKIWKKGYKEIQKEIKANPGKTISLYYNLTKKNTHTY